MDIPTRGRGICPAHSRGRTGVSAPRVDLDARTQMSQAPDRGMHVADGPGNTGGEMGALVRAHDWAATPLGPAEQWPQSLRAVVRLLLTSRFAMWMGWGPDLTFLYNDAYRRMTLGAKHPWALGRPAGVVWAEIWTEIFPRIRTVMESGEATWDEGLLLFLERSGYREETYHTFSYSPLHDDGGAVAGLFCVVTEETDRVIGERRLRVLREVAAGMAGARTQADVFAAVGEVLGGGTPDLPFLLVYLPDPDDEEARLAFHAGVDAGEPAAAPLVSLAEEGGPWPLARALALQGPVRVALADAGIAAPERGPWEVPASSALVLPLARPGQARPAGVLVAGLNPFRQLDEPYQGFINLLAGQVAAGLATAHAYEEERRRAAALAELDRAKTVFFSNVSHEFRTPLTLMLGPVEDALAEPVGDGQRERLEIVHRNARRLLRLVNSLLDFSRMEAGRVQASFEPLDLAALTAELASMFRSATDRAGLRLTVDAPPLPEPVYVDREMWEKVVLNLLSNAFKYTFSGEIAVSVRPAPGDRVELRVRDTGTGIPAAELPHLFQRFHRVEGARGRTQEGSGIGLALVNELVKLHGGEVSVTSAPGEGSTFVVSLPTGADHLPAEHVESGANGRGGGGAAAAFVDEALRWLPDAAAPSSGPGMDGGGAVRGEDDDGAADRPLVLLADDNADMRDYVGRLLRGRYRVRTAGDGAAALAAAREQVPDLVLSDVMMPVLDGFGLLRALREDPATREVPVLLLSARAGEESRVEGLQAGADGYMVKPFSARELVAQVGSQLELARVRRQAAEELRAAADENARLYEETLQAKEMLQDQAAELEMQAVELQTQATHLEEVQVELEVANDELNRANEGLRESEERFRNMADNAPVMLWVTDQAGYCTYLNRRWYQFTGQTPETGLGFGWLDATHPDDRERAEAVFIAANERHEAFRLEYRLRRQDGEYRWAIDAAQPRVGPHGEFMGYIGSVIDITERKRVEEEREAVLEESERARALADDANRAKSEFLASMSHELRTPLNAIAGYLDLLSLGIHGPVTDAQVDAMGRIKRNQEVLLSLINDVLNFAKLEAGRLKIEMEAVDVGPLLEALEPLIAPQLHAKSLQFRCMDCPIALRVLGDAERIQQILINLLTNAIKFTPPGGRIEIGAQPGDGVVRIVVSDTGRGIPAEKLEAVFDPFVQVDRRGTLAEVSQQGVGLGLAISRELARAMGGELTAESAVGAGSTFTLSLTGARDSG
jgi:PAS domain S-box-containing protein